MWLLKLGIRISSPIIMRDRHRPEMISRDLSRTILESFLLSIESLHHTDLQPNLVSVEIPIMGMYDNRDVIVSPNQWKPLQAAIPHARIER